jgi:hypothetical protein
MRFSTRKSEVHTRFSLYSSLPSTSLFFSFYSSFFISTSLFLRKFPLILFLLVYFFLSYSSSISLSLLPSNLSSTPSYHDLLSLHFLLAFYFPLLPSNFHPPSLFHFLLNSFLTSIYFHRPSSIPSASLSPPFFPLTFLPPSL